MSICIGTMFFAVYSTITNVWIVLWKRIWNKTLFQYWNKFNCQSNLCFFHLPTALFHCAIGAFIAQNNKSNNLYLLVMVCCNYRRRNRTRQIDTCPQVAVRCEQERQKYWNSPCINPAWGSLWSRSRTLCQRQITQLALCGEFQWCHFSSNAGNLRLT
jgi:hypothetical protein